MEGITFRIVTNGGHATEYFDPNVDKTPQIPTVRNYIESQDGGFSIHYYYSPEVILWRDDFWLILRFFVDDIKVSEQILDRQLLSSEDTSLGVWGSVSPMGGDGLVHRGFDFAEGGGAIQVKVFKAPATSSSRFTPVSRERVSSKERLHALYQFKYRSRGCLRRLGVLDRLCRPYVIPIPHRRPPSPSSVFYRNGLAIPPEPGALRGPAASTLYPYPRVNSRNLSSIRSGSGRSISPLYLRPLHHDLRPCPHHCNPCPFRRCRLAARAAAKAAAAAPGRTSTQEDLLAYQNTAYHLGLRPRHGIDSSTTNTTTTSTGSGGGGSGGGPPSHEGEALPPPPTRPPRQFRTILPFRTRSSLRPPRDNERRREEEEGGQEGNHHHQIQDRDHDHDQAQVRGEAQAEGQVDDDDDDDDHDPRREGGGSGRGGRSGRRDRRGGVSGARGCDGRPAPHHRDDDGDDDDDDYDHDFRRVLNGMRVLCGDRIEPVEVIPLAPLA